MSGYTMDDEVKLRGIVNEMLTDLEKALVEFGEYSFDDKGAREVMELGGYTKTLKSLPAAQAGYVLKLVAAGGRGGRGESLAGSLLNTLDNSTVSDDFFETVLEVSGLEY